jgi:hypothetical protein
MNKPGVFTLQRQIAQAVAETATAIAFGLPMAVENPDGSYTNELWNYGIHCILHGNDGIPQAYGAGDLVVVCDVIAPDAKHIESLKDLPPEVAAKSRLEAYKCEIMAIVRADNDGFLQPFIENPGEADLKKIIAEWLEKKELEVN